jgi:hypothetical protein
MLAVQLPFRMPSALAELATWAGALFNIDFGQVASPECSMADSDPGTIAITKFATTHVVFLCLNAILLIVGRCRNDDGHAFNAMTALYSIALGSLVRSCAQRLDCTWHDPVKFAAGTEVRSMIPG